MLEAWWSILERGGPVMWPLLVLSVVSLTLSLERSAWLVSAGRASSWAAARRASDALRRKRPAEAEAGIKQAGPLFGVFVRDLVRMPNDRSDARLVEAIETHRARVERFLPWLSMIITAAPMLGVLGTVLGIIESFELIGGRGEALGASGMDPRDVGAGIAEALVSTAAGLVVALLTLLPYVWLRARADALVGKLEALALSAQGLPSQDESASAESDG
ncbi:MAG: MotA/TolQ/ExbB proton channel family protein [Planctomycetota bacterium]